jgi:hypothetical protein
MTKTDWTPEGQPSEESDPLSATGMFLSALGKESDQPQKQPQETAAPSAVRLETKQPAWPAEQAPSSSANPASAAAPPSSSGEFTKLFQTAQPPPAVPPQTPAVASPPPVITPSSASAPGEFTRIFVKPSEANPADLPPAPLARSIPEPPPAAPGAPRMKGFSSGASDSASAEGGFTQLFQTRPSAPTPAPTPRVQAFTPPTPAPAPPAEDTKWPRQPEFKSGESPATPYTGSTSVTGLFASLGATDERPSSQRPTGQRQEETRPQPSEPFPSFSPVPPAAPSTGESGGVTRLIQRLSESERVAEPAPTAAQIPAPPVDSGPGEFTRMISASGLRAAASAPPAPAATPPASAPSFSIPAAPPLTIPPLPKPAAAPAPPAIPAPRIEAPKAIELPKAPIPKPAPPALPAAPGKFQEMVPILLVVNTFLLLVLIVLVIFALKAK